MNRRQLALLATVFALLAVVLMRWNGLSSPEAPAPEPAVAPTSEAPEASALVRDEPVRSSRVTLEPSAPVPFATRRLLLVDARTDEPLARFEVRIEPGSLRRASDAEGMLELPDELPADFELHLDENAIARQDRIGTSNDLARELPQSASVSVEPGAHAPVTVRLCAGPTFRLALAAPAGHAAESLEFELACADPSQRFDRAYASLRSPSAPWVRFRATATVMRGGPPWRLYARTRDGLWEGSAPVGRNFGIEGERIELTLESRARLEGRIGDASGAPLAEGYVYVERDGATRNDESNTTVIGLVDRDARYVLPCLRPGEYAVRHDRDGFLPFRARIAAVAGATTTLDIQLAKPPPSASGRVTARIESATGRFERTVYPYLRPAGSKTGSRRTNVEWVDENGARVGKLTYEDVPLGEYDLGVQVPGFVRVEQREQRVRPDDPAVVFRVRDDLWKLSPLAVVAVDEHGQALDLFLATVSVQSEWGEVFDRAKAGDGRARFAAAPEGVRARLEVSKDGWQTCRDEVELTAGSRELRVTLVPGWSIEVIVRDAAGTPLEGARVLFDGELAGVTDATGTLLAKRTAAPQTARIEYRDWVPTANSRLDATGRFRAFEPWLTVELAPPK